MAILSTALVLIGLAWCLAEVPGVAPRFVGPTFSELVADPVPCSPPACNPALTPSEVNVLRAPEATYVVLRFGQSPQSARVEIDLGAQPPLVLEQRGADNVWDAAIQRPAAPAESPLGPLPVPRSGAVASRIKGLFVLRVPYRLPAQSWTARSGARKIPPQGSAPVRRVPRPLDVAGLPPGPIALGALGLVVLGLSLSRPRPFRRAARATLFASLCFLGSRALASRLASALASDGGSPSFPLASPFLITAALVLGLPLAAWLVAWLGARWLLAREPVARRLAWADRGLPDGGQLAVRLWGVVTVFALAGLALALALLLALRVAPGVTL